ncbi:polysaccharide biosynthesis/export family protein [candidate division KSB1 bacterium]|nr:polysaccharide biosynthesis/export family protein [candidate division KSB1 bacterium]
MKRANFMLLLLMTGLVLSSCSVKPRSRRASPEADRVVIKFDEPVPENETLAAVEIPERTLTAGAASPPAEPIVQEIIAEETVKQDVREKEKVVEPIGLEESVERQEIDLEQKVAASRWEQPREYRLGYGDVLEVKFFNNPEYNETVTVRPDGRISLQQIGDLEVIGITPSELQRLVMQVYGEILKQPDVTIFVREFGGQFFYVMGEVERPGQFELSKGMTLLRAIATAGGAKNSGKMNSVILVRADQQHNIEARRLDLSISDVAKQLDTDLTLQPYDMVFIPKTFIANLDIFVRRVYEYVLPPTDLFYRYKYWYRGDF